MVTRNNLSIFRLFVPFAFGIIIEYLFNFEVGFVIPFIFLLFLLLLFNRILLKKFSSYRSRWYSGIIINLFLLLSGACITYQFQDLNSKDYFARYSKSEHCYAKIRIENKPDIGIKTIKSRVQVLEVLSSGKSYKTSGDALFYFQRDGLSEKIRYGDVIIVKVLFKEVKPPLNPSEFDYKSYLARNNIYHTAYIENDSWHFTGVSKSNFVYDMAYDMQDRMLNVLKKYGLSGKEYGLASALLIGVKNDLDPQTISEFQNTGTMHVLAVSGMHVGLIYIVLWKLLFFLDRNKKTRILKLFLILWVLIFYAFLTGLSASVLRATLMFGLLIFGQILSRESNVFNSMAVSAFILCIFQPLILFDAGFLLSYSAVLGILFLEPFLRWDFFASRRGLKEGWGLISVSVAAQGGTSPLSLFLFNQFPNFFLLSNLLIIPVSTIIIYLLLLLLVFSGVPLFANYLGWISGNLIDLMIWLNKSIGNLPYSVINDIHIYPWQAVSLFLSFVCLIVLLYQRKWIYANFSIAFLIVFVLGFGVHKFNRNQNDQLYIYNINKGTALSIVSGSEHYLIADSSTLNDSFKINFHLKKHFLNQNISDYKPVFLMKTDEDSAQKSNVLVKNSIVAWKNKVLFVLNQSTDLYKYRKINDFHPDLMLVTDNRKIALNKFGYGFKPGKIVLDGSNSAKTILFYKEMARENKIPIHVTSEEGWYEL